MAILVAGGAGFIGSHTCAELLDRGYEVIVVDNFSNSSPRALDAVHRLAGRALIVHELELRDRRALDRVFEQYPIQAVIHFAAKKAVRESMRIPFEYFDVNIMGMTSLLRSMVEHDVRKLVFSSSCSLYGAHHSKPITEDDPPGPTNPYARSKLDMRANSGRHLRSLSCAHRHLVALFQPGRRTFQRLARRMPAGHPEQRHALHDAGGRRKATGTAGIRCRL